MTVKPSPAQRVSVNPSQNVSRPILPRPVQIGALVLLVLIAVCLWSRPLLLERERSRATLAELELMAKQGDDPRVLYYLGLRQREKGDEQAAFETFTRATKLTVSDTQLWLALAESARVVQGDQAAFNILGMFVENNPGSAQGHLAMGRLYLEHRSWLRAHEEATLATKNDGKLSEAWRIIGQSALAMEKAGDAESAIRRAITLAPNDWQSQALLGDALTTQNRFAESVPFYQEAVRLVPSEPVPPLSLGRAFLKRDAANATPEQLKAAEDSLRQSIRLRADIPMAHLLLGQCLAQQNRLSEAREALEQARVLAPKTPDAYFELSRLAAKSGDRAGATKYLAEHEAVLKRRNEFGDRKRILRGRIDIALRDGQTATADGLRRELARILVEGEETTAALEQYDILLSRYPDDARLRNEVDAVRLRLQEASLARQPVSVLLAQGDALFAQKQFPAAVAAYRNALKQDAKSSHAAEGLGLALQSAGRGEEATYYLLAATHLDAKLPRAEFALALRYKEIGFLTQAAERFRKVVALEPTNASAWAGLGQVLRDRDGSEADAEAAFQEAVNQEPTNVAFLLDLADMQDTNNKKMQAETNFRRAVALAPNSAEAAASLGSFLVNNATNAARLDEAGTFLNRALVIDPLDDFARYYQGKLALQKGRASEAVTLLETVLKNDENAKNREIWYTLGRAYIRKGDAVKGNKALDIAHKMEMDNVAYTQAREQLALHPEDPARHLDLARALTQRGENARAIREYERTLRLDAKNTVAQRELTDLKARLKAEGAMPSMSVYDALVSAANRRLDRETAKAEPVSKK